MEEYRPIAIKIIVAFYALLISASSFGSECPSSTTINVRSSGYSGAFNIELRKGTRPGSVVVGTRTLSGPGRATFYQICKGSYFYAFGTADSDQVSVTRYFDVEYDGYSYSNPEITVFYSRSTSNSQRVGKARRGEL